jgi:hypothetical protein
MKSWRLRLCSAVVVELTPRERLLRLGTTALPDAELAGLLGRAREEAAAREAAEGLARKRSEAAAERRRERQEALRRAEHKNHVAFLRRELAPGESCPVWLRTGGQPPPGPRSRPWDGSTRKPTAGRRSSQPRSATPPAPSRRRSARRCATSAARPSRSG